MFRNIATTYASYIRDKFNYLTKEDQIEITYWIKRTNNNQSDDDDNEDNDSDNKELIFSSLKLQNIQKDSNEK